MESIQTNSKLKAVDIEIGYAHKKKAVMVASNISFEVNNGNFIALLGKNGIGKSTLLKTISKVIAPLDGTFFLNNKDISTFTEIDFAKTVSVVLTEKIPQQNLSIIELIALGRQPYTNWLGTITSEDKKQIHSAIEACELEHIQHKKCHEISDGQLQRVLIARALAQNTEVVLLDEPTAHLDIHHKISMFKLLKKLAKKTNKIIIVSTHEVNMALQLADELWLMSTEGFVTGTPKALTENRSFDVLFPSDLISFNEKMMQFIIKK